MSARRISLPVVIMAAFGFISCSKIPLPTDSGDGGFSVHRVVHSQTPLVSDSEYAWVRTQFQKNNLSLEDLQVLSVMQSGSIRYVRCSQFHRGLQIFYRDIVFSFNASGINDYIGGDTAIHITASPSPGVPMELAGAIFREQIGRDFWYKDSLGAFLKAGFDAELGFFDANGSAADAPENFVLAWKLTVTGRMPYPFAYVRADRIGLLQYWNGVIID